MNSSLIWQCCTFSRKVKILYLIKRYLGSMVLNLFLSAARPPCLFVFDPRSRPPLRENTLFQTCTQVSTWLFNLCRLWRKDFVAPFLGPDPPPPTDCENWCLVLFGTLVLHSHGWTRPFCEGGVKNQMFKRTCKHRRGLVRAFFGGGGEGGVQTGTCGSGELGFTRC